MGEPFELPPQRGIDAPEKITPEGFCWIDLKLSDFRSCSPALSQKLDLDDATVAHLADFDAELSDVRRPILHPNAVIFPVWAWNRDIPDVGGELEPTYQINVLIHGEAVVTVTDDVRHPPRLEVDGISAHSEAHAVYLVISAIFDTHSAELGQISERISELERYGQEGLFKRLGGQQTIAQLRADLSELRRAVAPERRLFDRLGVEIEHVDGLSDDHASGIERLQGQIDLIDDRIDAVSGALTDLIGLRISAIGFTLTALAAVLTPIAVITALIGIDVVHNQFDSTAGGIALVLVIVVATAVTFWWLQSLWGSGPKDVPD
jgi:Mg2+ and Co2+ transporter CorA